MGGAIRPCSYSRFKGVSALDVFKGFGQLSTQGNHELCVGAHQNPGREGKGREGKRRDW